MTKALIKETGEELEVKSMWQTMTLSFEFNFEDENLLDVEPNINKIIYEHNGSKDYPVDDVELSDGKTYKKSELVIGIDNIRDFKIKNIIE